MELPETIKAVGRMQRYIIANLDGEIILDDLASEAGYSKYHACRIFKKLTGFTLFEIIRRLRLTNAAKILQAHGRIADVAMQSGFSSHDGFTRAFTRLFGLTPQQYRSEMPPIGWFIYYPIEAYYLLKEEMKSMSNERVSKIVTVTQVERPARKLIYLRHNQTNYFSACLEVGCDWEGYFNSIPEKMETAASGLLPNCLAKPGAHNQAFFVEVPLDYDKPLLDGYEIAEILPCTYLYFNGLPYEEPNDFAIAIGIVEQAIKDYPFERFGWKKSNDAPYLGLGAYAPIGARIAVPVVKFVKAL